MIGEELMNVAFDQTGLSAPELSNNQDLEDIFRSGGSVSAHVDITM